MHCVKLKNHWNLDFSWAGLNRKFRLKNSFQANCFCTWQFFLKKKLIKHLSERSVQTTTTITATVMTTLAKHLWTEIILNWRNIHLQIKQPTHQTLPLNHFMYYAQSRVEILQFWLSSSSLERNTLKGASNSEKSRHGKHKNAAVYESRWESNDDAVWNEENQKFTAGKFSSNETSVTVSWKKINENHYIKPGNNVRKDWKCSRR